MSRKKGQERLLTSTVNNEGYIMTIIRYNGCMDITVKFQDDFGAEKDADYSRFLKGQISNPYHKTLFGVGYIGEGEHKSGRYDKDYKAYVSWRGVVERCYSKKYQAKRPTYIGCVLCDEWHNFSKFKLWFDDNYYEIDGVTSHLDKDILLYGNKLYSPDTCVFVPARINSLFTSSIVRRGTSPVGVNWDNREEKFVAKCNIGTEGRKHLGYYDSEIEAFEVYKKYKGDYVKKEADRYRQLIPEKLYFALLNYPIIDDRIQ